MSAPSPHRAPHLLVVEDDLDVRLATQDALEDAGYRVTAVEHGAAALAALRSGGPPVDLVLLDLMMPVMDGWGFLDERARDPRVAAIPVVVVSAVPPAQMKLQGRAQAFLRKPTNLGELLDTLIRLLGAAPV